MGVLWLIILLPVSALAQTQLGWKVYVDRLYGYSIPVPPNLQLRPWNGDPQSPWQNRSKTFQSADAKVSLAITTH